MGIIAFSFNEIIEKGKTIYHEEESGRFCAVNNTETTFDILKADDDKRLVFGWAMVANTVDGEQLEDLQHDIIEPEDLEEAVYKYVLEFRDGGEEHIKSMRKKASLVESVMFTKEKMKAMGIPEGIVPEGWWIGFYVKDDDAWERIKNGTYQMFSIEGQAIREPVQDDIGKADRVNGCGVLVVKDGKILTGTRIGGKHGNQICGPGGHIEAGESHEEAAIRESSEEFGIECTELTPLGILDGGRNYGKSAVFLCTEYEGEPKTDEEEMTDLQWRTIEELQEERLFRPFEQSLELLMEEIDKADPHYDEFPDFDMWYEENLEATPEEVKAAKEYYDQKKKSVAKTFSEIIEKFNPWHDRLGRFTSGSGGSATFMTTRTRDPKKQHMADMAIARVKQQAAQAAPPKPQKNYDKLGYADHDDADYHQLHSGRQYYQQQKLTPAQQKAATNYLESNPEPGSLYSHSQNMNWQMVNGQKLTGKYKQTHDGLMDSMHNLGYNLELTRYDHAGFVNGMLQTLGAGTNYERMSAASIKKALVGQTINENKFLSTSYNDFSKAPQSSKNVFDTRAVKIIYKAKADVQGMMPGKGPGGDLGEIILAPTNGTSNRGGKIVDVRLTGQMVRRKGTQTYNQPRIELVIEL